MIPFILRFSSREKYFPVDPIDYIAKCKLVDDNTGEVLHELGEIRPEDLHRDKYKSTRLMLDPASRSGSQNLEDVPIFHWENEIIVNQTQKFMDHVYIIFYSYNGTTEPHDFDAEFVTVRRDHTDQIIGFFLSQHGDAQWVPSKHMLKDESSGKFVIFVANESHANYRTSGTQSRAFGFASDFTNSGGPIWAPERLIYLPREPLDLPSNLKYLLFPGKRGVGTGQSFPPYLQQSCRNTLLYTPIPKTQTLIQGRIKSYDQIAATLKVIAFMTSVGCLINYREWRVILLTTVSVFLILVLSEMGELTVIDGAATKGGIQSKILQALKKVF